MQQQLAAVGKHTRRWQSFRSECCFTVIAQEALEAYQRHFIWSQGAEGGVLFNIERELSIRAAMTTDTPHSVFR